MDELAGTGDLREAWSLLEEEIAEALEGWDPSKHPAEERARAAAARVYRHLDTETMLRISYIMARRAIPWTPSSAAALSAAIELMSQVDTPVHFLDTEQGRVTARAELERLQEAAEEWREATDGAE